MKAKEEAPSLHHNATVQMMDQLSRAEIAYTNTRSKQLGKFILCLIVDLEKHITHKNKNRIAFFLTIRVFRRRAVNIAGTRTIVLSKMSNISRPYSYYFIISDPSLNQSIQRLTFAK